MGAKYDVNALGNLLQNRLKELSLSMRKLSDMTTIDVGTISKIINGKRQANLTHLEQFSHALQIPLAKMLEAIGFDLYTGEQTVKNELNMQISMDSIEQFLQTTPLFDINFSNTEVEKQLENFQQLANTAKGQSTILNKFYEKVNMISSEGPFIQQLTKLFEQFRSRKGRPLELAVIGGALLYFIMPFDVIPDHIFPIGYLDDVVAVKLALHTLGQTNI